MNRFVITVNRQFGSHGREIANRMGEILNIPCYDSEMITEVAQELEMEEEEVKRKEEKAIRQPEAFSNTFFTLGRGSTDTQDLIFDAQKNYIENIIKEGSCIVVGRCSDYILAQEKNAMHIYIYAEYSARLQYCREVLGLDKNESQRVLREVDELRDSYQMQYSGYRPDDKYHKDIMIDSSLLGVEKTADFLAHAVKMKFDLEEKDL